MVDLSTLPAAEMARHLGNPQGEVGIAVGERINEVNRNITEQAYRRLALDPGMRVMEIGFGNGHLVPDLLRHAPDLRYTGIDISTTMTEEARRFNAEAIAAGRVALHCASADAMPLPDASQDRVLAVNVVYFWLDPIPPLREIRRVLRPSGFSLIAAVTPQTVAGNPVFQPENGFHIRDAEALVDLHRTAGFTRIVVESVSEVVARQDGSPWTRDYNLIRAHP